MLPTSPFIFEYFLFNSLYHIDWEASERELSHLTHGSGVKEREKQKRLLDWIWGSASAQPTLIWRAFQPLLVDALEGDWTEISPGSGLTAGRGRRFFADLGTLRSVYLTDERLADPANRDSIYRVLRECLDFVYGIRNNLFHGSKRIFDVYDDDQSRRIEVYDLFLKGVTSLFFLVVGKPNAACDFVPYSIPLIAHGGEVGLFDPTSALRALIWDVMKDGDLYLIKRFRDAVPPPSGGVPPPEGSTLFYPSAGTDFLTPIILGLPYCREFLFFDNGSSAPGMSNLRRVLNRIHSFSNVELLADRSSVSFEVAGVERRVRVVRRDNREFLQSGAQLRFFFRRGDSTGEGGSNQHWDSEHLGSLIRLAQPGPAFFLTDGSPGGLDRDRCLEVHELVGSPVSAHRMGYLCGRLT